MGREIEQLDEIIKGSSNIVFFGGARGFYRERHSGFSECRRIVQPEI